MKNLLTKSWKGWISDTDMISGITLSGMAICAVFLGYFFKEKLPEGVLLFTILGAVHSLFFFLSRGSLPYRFLAWSYCCLLFFVVNILIYYFGGFYSPFISWNLLAPIAAAILLGGRTGIAWGFAAIVTLILWYFLTNIREVTGPELLSGRGQSLYLLAYLGLFLSQAVLTLAYFRSKSDISRVREASEVEQKQSQESREAVLIGQQEERVRISSEMERRLLPKLEQVREYQELLLAKARESGIETDRLEQELPPLFREVLRIAEDLSAKEIEKNGLEASIRDLGRRYEEKGSFQCTLNYYLPDIQLDSRQGLQLFRIIQEALNNADRHAQAGSVEIELRETKAGGLFVRVEDNGVGINKEGKNGMGLKNMESRGQALNGTFSIESQANRGTRITLEVPART